MAVLLAEHGLRVVSDDDLLDLARIHGLPARGRTSLRSGHVAVAEPVR
ncbi:hypothetical protein AB0F46_33645 [Streptomyces sp. NPDC026665]